LMEVKRDIENRDDIDRLMVGFYTAALADEKIGFIFKDVAKLDLESHLPVIGDFWETILFQNGVYARYGRTPLMVHGELNEKTPLLFDHFTRWLELFEAAVDGDFEGPNADFIKSRAHAIANRMFMYVSSEHPTISAFG
jgi:hemoglobin